MASEIKVDTIVNAGGDNDSGIDLSTNDVVAVKTANTERMRVDASGNVGIGVTPTFTPGGSRKLLQVTNGSSGGQISLSNDSSESENPRIFSDVDNLGFATATTGGGIMQFYTGGSERMRVLSTGVVLINKTADNETDVGVGLSSGGSNFVRNGGGLCSFNRLSNDGDLVFFKQDTSTEGKVSVSGSTVSYEGFSGLHESSGIPTNTPIGTVLSTIDELDVYHAKQDGMNGEEDNPKAGQTRLDHAKVEVSDTVGDSAVYGVVGKFNTQGKVMVASVGIGSVRVTGACAKGDLLESNGDGTAKVQSDDIVRSKTIGKVTIGNSNTGVKLVSCVLYCG